MSGDATRDVSGDGRWMTYGELAGARGIDRQSAVKLVRRQHWRRQEGNNGVTRVFVPADWLTRLKSRDAARDEARDETRDEMADLSRFDAALTALREAHAGEVGALQAVIDGLRDALSREGVRADQGEAGKAAERARADALRDRLTTMQEQLADARAALQAAEGANARAEQAEQGRERAEQGREAERTRADALRDRIDALQVQLTARQEVIDAAEATRRAEDARKARGRWARLRAAWRGE